MIASPLHASNGFKTDSDPRLFSPAFFCWSDLFMSDRIVNSSLSRILFFNLPACNGKYSLFSPSCNRRFGGGAIVETLLHASLLFSRLSGSAATDPIFSCLRVCVCIVRVCVYLFTKLYLTTQSAPVILVILVTHIGHPKGGSMRYLLRKSLVKLDKGGTLSLQFCILRPERPTFPLLLPFYSRDVLG